MGKPMNNSGTQVKERARQQKQAGKELKRLLTRQKKAYIKPSAPDADLAGAEPILTGPIVQSAD
jgi:hypothetical protein